VSNGDAVRTMWVPDLLPDDPAEGHQPSAALAVMREQKDEHGYIPVELPPAPSRGPSHYYGVLAEEVAAVAPDAVVSGGAGPMIDQSSMNGLLWAGIKALNEKLTALEGSGS
jgi:hypothetical protein